MTFRIAPHAAALAALLCVPIPGFAQARAAEPAQADDEPIIVTADRAERLAREVGQSVTVITATEIETRQSPLVADLLRTVAGVTVSRNGGAGSVTSVRIRGAEGDQTVALIDGVKLNDPSSPGGGFDFGNLLTGNIDRIEVVRGAQSVLWGSQAIGGVVNMITRAPTEDLAIAAHAEGGWRDSWQAVGNISGRAGPVAASIGGGWFTTDGISAFNEVRGGSERDGYENVGANAKLLIDVTDTLGIDLRAYYSSGETDIDGFPPPDFSFGDTRERSETEEFVGYAGINLALLDGRFKNRLGFAYTDTDRSSRDPDGFVEVTFTGRGKNERFEYQGVFTASDRLDIIVGAETETSRYAASSYGGPETRASTGIDSLYGQVSFAPVDGLRLSGGVRHDEHDDFGGETTFAASGVFSPNDGATQLRASYGEGFKAPSLYQLFGDYGNRALQPETSKSYDIGVLQQLLEGRMQLGATWFRRDTRDQIDFISCFGNPAPICDDRPFGTYDNIARTRADGVELTLALTPVDALTMSAQYSYIDTENRDTGRVLARRPRHSASALVDYRWSFGLSTGASVVHVSDSFDNAANTRRLPGYVLVDLRASLPLGDKVELYGRIENLFDEDYETAFGFGTAGRAAYAGVRLRL